METFLSNNETRVERLKFDDEKSVRETLVKDAGKDDSSSLGTLSEQDSIDIDDLNNDSSDEKEDR